MAGRIATHERPAWRSRSNWIIRVDLGAHGMPGSAEQLWAHTDDQCLFQLCCIPFFTYGFALGDTVAWDSNTDGAELVERSGRRVIRVDFKDPMDALATHEGLHGEIVGLGCLAEFKSDGYGAIDIESEPQRESVVGLLEPYVASERLMWEWGSE